MIISKNIVIITEKKPLEEILDMLSGAENVVVLGCSGCASVCRTGGETQVNELSNKLASCGKKASKFVSVAGVCHISDTRKILGEILRSVKADALVVLSCGSGVQAVSDIIPDLDVFPGLNSKRSGFGVKKGVIHERCIGCGDCILYLTGGICPFMLCPKNKFNGPCGDSVNGKCKTLEAEFKENSDCVWCIIYKNLKNKKREDLINRLFKSKPKDWSSMNTPQRKYLMKKQKNKLNELKG